MTMSSYMLESAVFRLCLSLRDRVIHGTLFVPIQQPWLLFLPNRISISVAGGGPTPGWVMSGQSQSQQSHSPVSKPNQEDVGGIKQKETKQDSPDATTEYIRPYTGQCYIHFAHQPLVVGSGIIPIIQMKKPRLRELPKLFHCSTAHKH